MNKVITIFFFYLISAACFAEATSDAAAPSFKLRGSVSFVLDYMTEYQDGKGASNHYNPVNYHGLDYTGSNDSHHSAGDPGRVIGGSWGGMQAKMYASYSVIAPLLAFNNPLMKDNSIKFTFNYEMSPVTLNGGTTVSFSPVAFLVFSTGFLIGPGWSLNSGLAGIGINDHGTIKRLAFGGPLLQQWYAVTFQMDTAYVLPESVRKWTHFVAIGTTTLKYQALLGVDANQPYMYEECAGEQLGGWRLLADALVGYRFFFRENADFDKGRFLDFRNDQIIVTAGIYAMLDYLDISHYNDSPMSDGWGSDFAYVNFGPAMQVDLPHNVWFKLFAFFRNDKVYTDDTVGNLDFRDRKYETYTVFFRWFGGFIGWNF